VDETVIRLTTLLHDEAWVHRHALRPDAPIADRQAASVRAADAARHLASADPAARRTFAMVLLEQVRLAPDEITLTIKLDLINPTSASRTVTETQVCQLARRGQQTRLIIADATDRRPEPDPTLLKALAQANRWWRDLLSQRYPTIREIAIAYATDERYVARIIPLAFLPAPQVEAILSGTQPRHMTLLRWMKAGQNE
jgi:hypothetical protein